jgi:hypothetical protein
MRAYAPDEYIVHHIFSTLDGKDICAGNMFVHLVQVHWSELPASWTTWENEACLKKEFPNATSWGQAGIQDGGMSGAQHTHTEEAYEKPSKQ